MMIFGRDRFLCVRVRKKYLSFWDWTTKRQNKGMFDLCYLTIRIIGKDNVEVDQSPPHPPPPHPPPPQPPPPLLPPQAENPPVSWLPPENPPEL